MPPVPTPAQLTLRAGFYAQLGQLTAAGVGLPDALSHLAQFPPSPSLAKPLQRLCDRLNRGAVFSEAVLETQDWVPTFDVALLRASEESGRLDACFRLLAGYYADRAQLTRQLLADLAYPVALFHLAVFIFPFSQLFISGDWAAYLFKTFGILLPIYTMAFALVLATQGSRGERWRAGVETVLRKIPLIGAARKDLALTRLCAALEALLSAGVGILEAWSLAADASGSPELRRSVHGWKPALAAGRTPAELVEQSGIFPDLFRSQYSTGEISGSLDETLRGMRDYYGQEATRKLRLAAQWGPRVFYFLVVLLIAWQVVHFWTGYFQQVEDAMRPM